MNIKFQKVILKNFMSFGDAEVVLSDRGYCIVNGVNNCTKDSSISNGSGKSSIWSAISYALTGETIQGLRSNIVNINADDGCFVKLFFSVDSDAYEVTRYKDYSSIGTDLKVVVNGKDVSGKGVRESQQILEQYLPDLTTDLIGSVIILGQGLPHKFTNNTPSGRKEVLEKLSKTDFMIQDIKARLDNRLTELNGYKRALEDSILSKTSQLYVYSKQHTQSLSELEKFSVVPNYSELIEARRLEADKLTIRHTNYTTRVGSFNQRLAYLNEKLLQATNDKMDSLDTLKKEYENEVKPLDNTISDLKSKLAVLTKEINTLKAITDTCPTCGQKLHGVTKPDVTEKEGLLQSLLKAHNDAIVSHNDASRRYNDKAVSVTDQYNADVVLMKGEIAKANEEINKLQLDPLDGINFLSSRINVLNTEINNLENEKNNFNTNKLSIETKISQLSKTIDELNEDVRNSEIDKQELQKHIDVVNKMITYSKRDFRGFLLSGVIEFIDAKAKEYSMDVFGTSELDFKLNGNNIDISYSGKSFENLSGGEKQRVDLIIQFSVRDMMSQYLSFTSNILVLDEIFDGLDIKGTTNVLNLISRKLNDVESVFIISHNELLEIPYDDIITVVKNEEGISKIR